jgi:hypothetical protein
MGPGYPAAQNEDVEGTDALPAGEGKRLISVYPKDLTALDHLLTPKLRLFGFVA